MVIGITTMKILGLITSYNVITLGLLVKKEVMFSNVWILNWAVSMMIQITIKSLVHVTISHPTIKCHWNLFIAFAVMLVTEKQTNATRNLTSLLEIITLYHALLCKLWPILKLWHRAVNMQTYSHITSKCKLKFQTHVYLSITKKTLFRRS